MVLAEFSFRGQDGYVRLVRVFEDWAHEASACAGDQERLRISVSVLGVRGSTRTFLFFFNGNEGSALGRDYLHSVPDYHDRCYRHYQPASLQVTQ